MLPKINNKSLLECNEDDLEVLIGNQDYRENEYIDYKETFSFLEVPKEKKREKIYEFRNDVCSFANAEGGYLVYGISDENGCAKRIIGVDIIYCNTDRFELDRRNDLAPIFPKSPYMKFSFVKLKNDKFVVVLYIRHDNCAPYTHIVDESSYKLYKRTGNRKTTMTYTELKNMFNQSLGLEKEIHNYRKERIEYYLSQAEIANSDYSRFMLFHIIPETFLDSNYDQNMFIYQKCDTHIFSRMFTSFHCSSTGIPCVDGLRYIPYDSSYGLSECYINNNGVVECFYSLTRDIKEVKERASVEHIPWKYLWDKVNNTYSEYCKLLSHISHEGRIYICLSFIGCKGVRSQDQEFNHDYTGTIDRNTIMCCPVEIVNADNEIELELMRKKLYIEVLLSLGIKYDDLLTQFIDEVYRQ